MGQHDAQSAGIEHARHQQAIGGHHGHQRRQVIVASQNEEIAERLVVMHYVFGVDHDEVETCLRGDLDDGRAQRLEDVEPLNRLALVQSRSDVVRDHNACPGVNTAVKQLACISHGVAS